MEASVITSILPLAHGAWKDVALWKEILLSLPQDISLTVRTLSKKKWKKEAQKHTYIRWEARARARGREMKHEEAQSVLHSSQLQTSTGEWDTAISSWEEENPASHAEFSVWDAERGASHMDSSKTTLLRAAGSVRDN